MARVGSVVSFPRPDSTTEPAALRATPKTDGGVRVTTQNLAKRFGDQIVLRTVDIDIAPGEFVAIVGHSGCGKSTLLRLIAGLDSPSAGAITVDGKPVAGQVGHARIMFQESRLLPWRRVLANVAIGLPKERQGDALEALDQVGLSARLKDWPSILSGGQRQRVALARALVSHPKLLLLDEPLGALDALTRLEMQNLVERVWQAQGFTALLVTHDVGEAVALADRIIVLEHGEISMIKRVDTPRPRRRGDPALAAIEAEILGKLMGDGARA